MAKDKKVDLILNRVMAERNQDHDTRSQLFIQIERILQRPLVTFFTSFGYPVMMEDSDVDILAGLIQQLDLSNGLALMISSPGGDGLAAERMINVCRSYSGTGDYWAIVPAKAKSAATMVCFGANKIYMGATSELGPVDPQTTIDDNGYPRAISVFHIVESFRELFDEATQTSGRLEPYLQQLQKYDASIIASYESAIELSKDISIRALKTGMLSGLEEKEIESQIQVFLTPESTKTHGRPIYKDIAKQCGLEIEEIVPKTEVWNLIYELYIRTNNYVSNEAVKCIESKDHSYVVPAPRGR
jgi:hypothetical protein